MRIGIAGSAVLYKSLKSIIILILILLFRRRLNLKSTKGNIILWTLLLIYLIFPKDILFSIKTYEASKFIKTILRHQY